MVALTLIYGSIAAIVLALWAARRYPERSLDSWAVAHGLQITDANRTLVTWYLRTGRQLRTIGVLAGLVLPPLCSIAFTGVDYYGGASFGYLGLICGHLAGSLYAELALTRPTGPRAQASLVPRQLSDYLPGRMRIAPRAVAGAALVAGVAATLLPNESQLVFIGPPRPNVEIALLATAVVAVVALVEALERLVVRRPQSVANPDLLAADDAIRASSVHSLCGAGMAIALILASGIFADIANAGVGVLGATGAMLTMLSWFGAYVAFLYYGNRAWRVARSRRTGALAAVP